MEISNVHNSYLRVHIAFAQILKVVYHSPKTFSRSLRGSPYQHAPTKCPPNHPRFGLENECYHSAQEWNTKGHVNSPTFSHLSTLQKLKEPYLGTSVNEPWHDSLKQLIFATNSAQFQPHFLHLTQSQILHLKQS